MDVFAIQFNGHYPVGACAVVVAPTEAKAKDMLMAELKVQGLSEKNTKKDLEVTKVNQKRQGVTVVLNGDY